jgi:hypothetical protein
MTTHTIIVFPDGETWNTADGSAIMVVTDEQFRDLIEGRIDAGDIPAIASISLADFTPGPRNGSQENTNV